MFLRALSCSYLFAPNRINTQNKHVGTVYRIFIDLSDMDLLKGLIGNVCHFVSSLKQTYWVLTHLSNMYVFFENLIFTFSLIPEIFTWRGFGSSVIYGIWLYSNIGVVISFLNYLPNAFWLTSCIFLIFTYFLNPVFLKCCIISMWGAVLIFYNSVIYVVLVYCLAFFLLIVQYVLRKKVIVIVGAVILLIVTVIVIMLGGLMKSVHSTESHKSDANCKADSGRTAVSHHQTASERGNGR